MAKTNAAMLMIFQMQHLHGLICVYFQIGPLSVSCRYCHLISIMTFLNEEHFEDLIMDALRKVKLNQMSGDTHLSYYTQSKYSCNSCLNNKHRSIQPKYTKI